MTHNFVRSNKADVDITSIAKRSIHDFGVIQTRKYMTGLQDSFQMLADNPKLGCTYLGYFYFKYKSHVIYYRQRKSDIFITRILHEKMLTEKHIKKCHSFTQTPMISCHA
jgi:toxin ParE1/3/4